MIIFNSYLCRLCVNRASMIKGLEIDSHQGRSKHRTEIRFRKCENTS